MSRVTTLLFGSSLAGAVGCTFFFAIRGLLGVGRAPSCLLVYHPARLLGIDLRQSDPPWGHTSGPVGRPLRVESRHTGLSWKMQEYSGVLGLGTSAPVAAPSDSSAAGRPQSIFRLAFRYP